jgi:hypothetical protein
MSFTALSSGFLAPTEDEHVSALLYEPLRHGESNAAVSAADDCNLAFQSRHDGSFSSHHRFVWGRC